MSEENKVLDPFVADVFTAMFSQSASLTNAVFDDYERAIAEWKQDFASLFDAVAKANLRVDSAQVERILDGFDFIRSRANPKEDS